MTEAVKAILDTVGTRERWLVCGGRGYGDINHVFDTLDGLVDDRGVPEMVITGGAEGADKIATWWASRRHIEYQTFRAQWKTYGRQAGPMRNQQMMEVGKPTLVIAFAGGRGTADMVDRAELRGIEVIKVAEPVSPLGA